jgi:transcriptional regulator with XRE-family HTH domain
MNFRLQQFLSAENITQAQFADEIGVARASVSHILAGRNKPGFDFIANMSRHYPFVNLEWLINGKGKMYKDGRTEPEPAALPDDGRLFEPEERKVVAPAPEPEPEVAQEMPPQIINKEIVKPEQPKVKVQQSNRKIVRIVVFYDDNSYQELQEV